jgi:hypothetical protein
VHFDFTITFGNVFTSLAVIGAIFRFEYFAHKIHLFLMEHEILMHDYAKRNGIEIADLPTRLRK